MDNEHCEGSSEGHTWIAGGMYIRDDELEYVASWRDVKCENCSWLFDRGDGHGTDS
jgi:hypothetical protein